MAVHVFLDASVTPRHASIGSYIVLKNDLSNYISSELKPKIIKLSLQSHILANLELAIEVMELISKDHSEDKVILYTSCDNLINLHTVRRHDPRLLFHRNYRDIYKPLLNLLENVTVIKIHPTTKSQEADIFRVVSLCAQRSKL